MLLGSCCLQREQMFTYEITFLPTSLPSLPSSYRRVRMVVGYPDGGISNPMALSFVPRAGLEAGKLTSKLPISATSQGSWQQQPQPPPAFRPSSDVDLCFMTVRLPGTMLWSLFPDLLRGTCSCLCLSFPTCTLPCRLLTLAIFCEAS